MFGLSLILMTLFLCHLRYPRVRFVFGCLLFFCFGLWRYQWAIIPDQLAQFHGEHISLKGYIAAEPDQRIENTRYILEIETKKIVGRVLLLLPPQPQYSYGDQLHLDCILRAPKPFDGFRYDMYLARFKVFSLCDNSTVQKIESGKGNALFFYLLKSKAQVANTIAKLWPEPYASLMAGLLYGYRGGLGELTELFNRTGVTHIIAISGYNMTLVTTSVLTSCFFLSIRRQKAFWVALAVIIIFVFFTGASASVVRAGIMGCIVLISFYLGRGVRLGSFLIFTAAVMVLHEPLILRFDIGFQLSFAATIGLIYGIPKLRPWFVWLPEFFGLKEIFLSTVAAILFTSSLILFYFDRFSLVALFVNLLILWAIPYVMGTGFLAVVLSFFFWPVGQWLAALSWLGMVYVVEMVRWFSALSFASVSISLPMWVVVVFYVILWRLLVSYKL